MNSRSCTRRHRRGFVTLLAIALMAMVALALAGLTTRMNTTMHQAREEQEQVQADQLILAGIEFARQNPDEREILLPTELAAQGVKLKISTRDKQVEIEARLGKTHRYQR
jgi:type II secretory pathway component PulK